VNKILMQKDVIRVTVPQMASNRWSSLDNAKSLVCMNGPFMFQQQ